MPKVDIWSRLTPQSQAAVTRSREQYATFKASSTDPLTVMREGYNHERRYWNSFPVDLPSVQDHMLDAPGARIALRLYSGSRCGCTSRAPKARCRCCCTRMVAATSWATSTPTTASAA